MLLRLICLKNNYDFVWTEEGYDPVYVSWCDRGIAYRLDNNCVRVNKYMNKYPALLRVVLNHEARHTNSPSGKFNINDFMLDITEIRLMSWQFLHFFFLHPSAWVQVSPMWISKEGKLMYDLNCLVFWLFIIGFTGGGVLLLKWLI